MSYTNEEINKCKKQLSDDMQLCRGGGTGNLIGSQFCVLFQSYNTNLNSGNLDAARDDRNVMIEIVRGQIDSFYKLRKDGRKSKIRWLQTILDFLEIGAAAAIAIMNGARAKTIAGVGIGALQGGRPVFNKNFEVLQTQVLINKMNTNRALILTEIYGNLDKPVRPTKTQKPSDAYSWYGAKNDLRRYLFAGTFDNALDSQVKESGADVDKAERQLRRVEKRKIGNESSTELVDLSLDANEVLAVIDEKLRGADKDKENATQALKGILTELDKTPVFESFFKGKKIKSDSDGKAIYKALKDLLFNKSDDDDLTQIIFEAIIAKGGKIK